LHMPRNFLHPSAACAGRKTAAAGQTRASVSFRSFAMSGEKATTVIDESLESGLHSESKSPSAHSISECDARRASDGRAIAILP
jgi:hypothetical protein